LKNYQISAGFESSKVDHIEFRILVKFSVLCLMARESFVGENFFVTEDVKRNLRDNFVQFSTDETTSFTYIRNNDEGFEPRTDTGQDSID